MASSVSEFSDANSFRLTEDSNKVGPQCYCGRKIEILKSWSDENPCRLYFRCAVHTFVAWADEETPCKWQKTSLLEARDIMRRQRDEIRQLKAANAKLMREGNCVQHTEVDAGDNVATVDATKKVEVELIKAGEREKILRHCLTISWVGFIIAIAIIASRCLK
ncbi:uncharacterized protein At4g04775-like [Brassica napus]|uniref:uncharacterized protein At4g04775-like n=1 Tax=Brassica napus TaxID=3708 RepID=UPI0006AAE7CA|nr:uncharacterized protein At4g04775-like [Brassica napus]